MSVIEQFLTQPFERTMKIVNVDKENRSVELAFSSEYEAERWPGVIEILSHEPNSVILDRLNGGANLLFNHDFDLVLGVVESARIDCDRVGRAVVRFGNSALAHEKWRDVQDGILRNVSVGYRIYEVKETEPREKAAVFTVTKWEPYEISLVSVPVDPLVGVGRSQESNLFNNPIMNKATTTENETVEASMSIKNERDIGRQGEQTRVRTIVEAGKKYNASEIAERAIIEGRTIDEFREMLLDEVDKRNRSVMQSTSPIGLSECEARTFSFTRLVRALDPSASQKAKEEARFELEACEAAAEKVTHRSVKGTMIPIDVMATPLLNRADTISIKQGSGYTGSGGHLVETELLTASFIDLLRNRTVAMSLGSQLAGLVGNIDIPKQSSGSSGYWIGEDEDAIKQDVNFGAVELRPKTVANYGEITRKMLNQSSIGIEALFRADLARGLSHTIDLAAFYGSGTSNQPLGIKGTAGISNLLFANMFPSYAELVEMETRIAMCNADVASMAYIANAQFRGYAKTTRKFPEAVDGGTLWEGGTLNGYRTEISNQVASGDIFFGNFSDFLIGLWGGLEITVDPYTHSTKGRLRIVTMQDVDFVVRRPESFCYGASSKVEKKTK